MSLINRMLQDLDKRHASGAERGVLPKHVRVLPRASAPPVPWWALGIAAALAVISAAAWYVATQPSQRESPVIAAAVPAPPAAPVPHASSIAPGAETSAAAPAVTRPDASVSTPVAAHLATATVLPIPSSAVIGSMPAVPVKAPPIAVEPERAKPVSASAPAVSKAQPVQAATPTATAVATAAPSPAPKRGRASQPPASSADTKAQAALENPQIDKRAQPLTPAQLAESEYREGARLLGQGRLPEAHEKFRVALTHDPGHVGARQGSFGLLLEAKKTGEAEQLLKEALELNAHQPGFAMALARMQVDRGDTSAAMETLQRSAPAASGSPDYLAFLAALLQRQTRHLEAVEHYRAALSLAPGSGVWLMGLGISLQALNRTQDAREAFQRARATRTLNPELQAFVDQRLTQLQ